MNKMQENLLYNMRMVLNFFISLDIKMQQIQKQLAQGIKTPYQLLMKYIELENLQYIEYLLQHGANVTINSVTGIPIFLRAIQKANIPMVKLLLRYGANPKRETRAILFAVLFAVVSGNLPMVQFVVEELGGDVNCQRLPDLVTPLMLAVPHNLAMILYLQSKGADIHARDKSGQNLLMYAIRKQKSDIILWCLHHGIDVNAKTNILGNTALSMAINLGDWDIVRLLIEDYGADPNQTDSYGENILMKLARNVELEVDVDDFDYLIQFIDDINAKNDQGDTVLHIYLQNDSYVEIVELLVDKGADIFVKNKQGQNALQFAEDMRNEVEIETVEFLTTYFIYQCIDRVIPEQFQAWLLTHDLSHFIKTRNLNPRVFDQDLEILVRDILK
jgi:ankyrin repeat protein